VSLGALGAALDQGRDGARVSLEATDVWLAPVTTSMAVRA
jgi:hypothetical protein